MSSEPTITVPFVEENGSPNIETGDGGVRATRTLKMLWADVPTFAREAMGLTQIGGEQVFRVNAIPFDEANWPGLRAVAMSVQPWHGDRQKIISGGGLEQPAQYTHASVRIQFAISNKGTADQAGGGGDFDDTLYSEQIDLSAEYLTIITDDLMWYNADSQQSIGGGVSVMKRMPIEEWTVTRSELPAIPEAIYDHVGKINTLPVIAPIFGRVFGPGSLLYNGSAIRRDVNPTTGAGMFQINQRFSVRNGGRTDANGFPGWQYIWRSDTGVWDRIATPGGGEIDIYEAADLNPVIGIFGPAS